MRIGVWSKILHRDAAGEFIVVVFKNMFLTRGFNHIIVTSKDPAQERVKKTRFNLQ
jgi:formate/nitrite transporter FocA (FNT family)